MPQSTRTLLTATFGAVVALAAANLGTARSVAPPQGTRVASVNLGRVMDKLQERQAWRDRRLMALAAHKRRADKDIGK